VPAPAPVSNDFFRRRALLQQKPATVSTLYNEGKTLVHEVGHWLSVLHTFQGGCANSDSGGDGCGDTPAEKTATFGCPPANSIDTCTSLPGFDSLSNFMAYTTDPCMDRFTPRQMARMLLAWQELRVGVPVA
jgi:hypothetical protein